MGASQDAQELVQTCREELLSNSSTCEITTYDARKHGGSLHSTLAPSARNILDIDQGTQLRQFVNVEAGAIILIPENND